MTIPVYASEANGENIQWMPGQKAIFTGTNGKTARVTVCTGDRVRAVGAGDDICLEVTFDDENNVKFCVRAKQLSLSPMEDKP